MMILQAFFDDSGNEPSSPVFVLAGLISTYQRWAKFSDEWQAALDEPPRLDYFKMAEAEHFNKQFAKAKGWTSENRDARVLKLAALTTKCAIGGVYVHLSHEVFYRWISGMKMPARNSALDHPYFTLFNAALRVVAVLRTNVRSMMGAQCDIIFDTQGSLGADAVYYWDRTRDIPGYSKDPPIFRDEKEFLPLQAADLYAWHLRRKLSNHDSDVMRQALSELDKLRAVTDIMNPSD